MFSYSQQGFPPSYCTAYIAGSKAVEGRYQTMPGSVLWEKCSPWGQSRQHLHFYHWHRAPLQHRMSNNACKIPSGTPFLVVLQEHCHNAAVDFNGWVLHDKPNESLPNMQPYKTLETALSCFLLSHYTQLSPELLTNQYTLFRSGLERLYYIMFYYSFI